ncbi:contactin-associated protein like 5-3-like [Dendronephthya gigantea]|uniref:contactin-associated protein like 5-3-like n=1 Tax=Dendronephthya gigantea TaxID=151771 RepID=UPI00106958B2|nr:contactin-associated protein like 5-3-like [Dendronephthya gigantea]
MAPLVLPLWVLTFILRSLQPGECVQAIFRKNDGNYSRNHVIETKHAETDSECSMRCLGLGSCVSVNYKISGIGKGLCELNSEIRVQNKSNEDKISMRNHEFNHYYIIKKVPPKSSPTSTPQTSENSTGNTPPVSIESSCTMLRTKDPSADTGVYSIKPEGLDVSIQVFCNMTSRNGIGETVIGHDSESRTSVDGYIGRRSYERRITYEIPMEQIVAIIDQSKSCEQFIKYECYGSSLLLGTTGWWVSRHGLSMKYWGGAAVNSGKCACGMTNSCAGEGRCNCDKKDQTWREDSGYFTDKRMLPVTELRFGDTGGNDETNDNQVGYHTLGKLHCWG